MDELLGVSRLKSKLASKKNGVNTRYEYYDQKYVIKDNNMSTAETKRNIKTMVGWCTKAVDALADRLVFRGFKNDNFDLMDIFNMNNPDILFDSAIISALISSCCFIYISKNEDDDYPTLQVIDGGNATGVIDTKTGLLKEGYAVLDTDDKGNPTIEAYFTSDYTQYFEVGKEPYIINNPTGYPLLVPIINKPSDTRPFGHSVISHSMMDITQSACKTLKRVEISSEFYSYPQKYLLGISEDLEIDKWKSTMSSMLVITKDEDGDKPTIGQFQQQSMQPHLDQFQMYVKQFCGEAGLTADDLGFISSNPSSAEAIKAGHNTLNKTASKAQRSFGRGFLNVGFVARCLMDEYQYRRNMLYQTVPEWNPIFEPDAAMLSSIGDGMIKINQAIPGYFNKDNAAVITGLDPSDMDVEDVDVGE